MDIERIEWWITAEHKKRKIKESLERLENEKTLCEVLKSKTNNNDKISKTNQEDKAK